MADGETLSSRTAVPWAIADVPLFAVALTGTSHLPRRDARLPAVLVAWGGTRTWAGRSERSDSGAR
jgi:hypothetical protein